MRERDWRDDDGAVKQRFSEKPFRSREREKEKEKKLRPLFSPFVFEREEEEGEQKEVL